MNIHALPAHNERLQPLEASADTAIATPATREILACRLGTEQYGISILNVQEIRNYETPTRIAGAPGSVRGVLNLRGVIVPVVDLRLRFGVHAGFDASTVTVVLNLGTRTVGAVVDSVSDVIELAPHQIKPAPQFDDAAGTRHITGLAGIGQGDQAAMLILLDIEHLMADTNDLPASFN